MPDNRASSGIGRGIAWTLLGIPAAWIGYSALAVDHNVPLPPAIDAERKLFISSEAGLLSYYADTDAVGRPLVLLHSINAAASAYEVRPLFEHFRQMRPVYALDLPGFGFSERSNREYTPQLYAQAISDFLETQVGEAADVIALSLTSEFAAAAALQHPELFHTLTMISPTGFSSEAQGSSQRAGQSGLSDFVYNLFAFPLWSQAFYDLLATPGSIRYFLQRQFVGPYDAGMADYDDLTSHQPGARYAPLYFISGKLFRQDIRGAVYERLRIPVLVIYDRDPNVTFDYLDDFQKRHANWYSTRIRPTLGLPHFERMPETAAALENFWAALDPLKPFQPNVAGWSGQDAIS